MDEEQVQRPRGPSASGTSVAIGRGRGVTRVRGHGSGQDASATSAGIDRGIGREGTARLGQGRREDALRNAPNEVIPPHAARVPGLARNPPLLSQQEGHRSSFVLSGCHLKPLFVRKHKDMEKMWDDRFRPYLVRAGFYGLHQIGYVRSDRYLISALVERWRPETHTFHLPVGEMTVTLQDVAVLLGLPIDGKAVYDPHEDKRNWPQMIRTYLGREVDEHTFRKGGLNIFWLRREFERRRCPAGAVDAVVECYVRAYMLMLLGSILFTDLSGNAIPIRYLPFLMDLNKTGRYSWGSAALAYLNKELCRVCQVSNKQMGGSILLLQIWAWERFLLGRPEVRNGTPKPRLGGPEVEHRPPYGFLWSGYHDWTKNPGRVLEYYRDELDYLRDFQVNWKPYTERRLALLPPICTSARDLWTYTGPLIHFQIVEPHNPGRVMRQFGKHQQAPPNRAGTLDASPCSINGPRISRAAWRQYVNRWRNRRESRFLIDREYDPSMHAEYMEWYSSSTRLYLRPARSVGPLPSDPRDLLYQIRAGITHKAAQKIEDLRTEAEKKMAEAADDGTRAFAAMMMSGFKDLLEILGEFDSNHVQKEAQLSRAKRLRGE